MLDAVGAAKGARAGLESGVVVFKASLIHEPVLHACSPVMVRVGRSLRRLQQRAVDPSSGTIPAVERNMVAKNVDDRNR